MRGMHNPIYKTLYLCMLTCMCIYVWCMCVCVVRPGVLYASRCTTAGLRLATQPRPHQASDAAQPSRRANGHAAPRGVQPCPAPLVEAPAQGVLEREREPAQGVRMRAALPCRSSCVRSGTRRWEQRGFRRAPFDTLPACKAVSLVNGLTLARLPPLLTPFPLLSLLLSLLSLLFSLLPLTPHQFYVALKELSTNPSPEVGKHTWLLTSRGDREASAHPDSSMWWTVQDPRVRTCLLTSWLDRLPDCRVSPHTCWWRARTTGLLVHTGPCASAPSRPRPGSRCSPVGWTTQALVSRVYGKQEKQQQQ
jgi:hypothetical protein